jgi:hypothetical protein
VAEAVFNEFRAYQRSQPILNLAAFPTVARMDAPPAPPRDEGLCRHDPPPDRPG